MPSAVASMGQMERSSPKTQEERTAAAKAAIRVAALELFALQGYDLTTLSQISSRADFSRGLAQYHYKTKEALAEELLDEAVAWQVHYHGLRETEKTASMNVLEHLQYQVDKASKLLSDLLSGERSLEYRGQALLSSIATISSNDRLRQKIQYSNSIVGSRISNALKEGIKQGVVRDDVDPDGAVAFYIATTWGLLNGFCAEPLHHERVLQGVETLRQAIQSWGRSEMPPVTPFTKVQ